MIIRFTRTITLPSGNTARNFRFNDRGHGLVQVTYEYTDRRRNHQVARRFTVEFLNGHLYSIQARSANGSRVEYFSTSTIIDELLEMLNEFNEIAKGDAYMIEETETEQNANDTNTDITADSNAIADLKFLWGVEIIHLAFTFLILLIIWYNV